MAVPADSGAKTSLYWAMPSNTAIWISWIFRDRAKAELIYFLIYVLMFSIMFQRLMWTNFFYYILAGRLYDESLSQVICHFDTGFFELCWHQITTDTKRTNKILQKFTCSFQTPRNTTRKIANRYFERIYHSSTLQKKDYFWTRVYIETYI